LGDDGLTTDETTGDGLTEVELIDTPSVIPTLNETATAEINDVLGEYLKYTAEAY
jgi:hypothetical protein